MTALWKTWKESAEKKCSVCILPILSFQDFNDTYIIVQVLSHVQFFATPCSTAYQDSLSAIISQSSLKFVSIVLVILSNHLILCCPLLLQPSIFSSIGSFLVSQLFTSGGQSFASVLPINIQGRFLLGLAGLISLQSRGFLRDFSNTTVQKHQFLGAQPSLWTNYHIHT